MADASHPSDRERAWVTAIHATSLVGFVIPLGNVIAPLVLWLISRRISPFVDEQGREALNFNLSIVLYAVIAGILILLPVGLVILIATAGMLLVLPVVATIQGARGEEFHYPAAIGFLRWTAVPTGVQPPERTAA
jgi:uncharacterized Tic20 family protein